MKKNNKLGMIILFSVLGLLIVIATIVVILSNNNSANYKFIGKWSCNDGSNITITSNKYILEADNIYIEATYKIEYDEFNETPIGNFYKTGLILKATKRIRDGKEYTDPYETKYEFNIEEGKEDVLNMINSVTYNMYVCYKK